METINDNLVLFLINTIVYTLNLQKTYLLVFTFFQIQHYYAIRLYLNAQ